MQVVICSVVDLFTDSAKFVEVILAQKVLSVLTTNLPSTEFGFPFLSFSF